MSDHEIHEIQDGSETSYIATAAGTTRDEAEQMAARARATALAARAGDQPDVDFVAREISGYDTGCRIIATLPKAQADSMTEDELAEWDAARLRTSSTKHQQASDAPDADGYVTRVHDDGDRRMIAVVKKGSAEHLTDEELFRDLEIWAAQRRLRSVEDPGED
ncbi:hypothetical protein [Streptomyces cucumeris]|uniref:hypothetical protein n=1 Tax=Streptomyces cucumeris TaxID=2962890 RepID=UPI0020C85EFB|nr:hypothetical protein [Streptomyces sp. NEAU-Y11]MCP9205529.1 hypothetical protein [Streptomyces sp. NEAU-Y11]